MNVGGTYRIPGEVVPDLEPQPLAVSYALPDGGDELAPLVGEPRIADEPELIGEHWEESSWHKLTIAVCLAWAVTVPLLLL